MSLRLPKAAAPALITVLALAAISAWWFARAAFLAAYLAAWWFCAGLTMGGLANVWVHNLTGGRWGEAIRGPLLDMARGMWLLALLFLPVLLGLYDLYPWAAHASRGVQRWAGELPARSAEFKSAWLMPWFFILRSVGYLTTWCVLAWLSRRPALQRSARFSAAALIVYGLTVSMAAVDWIMSLMPLWYSSVFGLLAGTGQMLTGMGWAVVLAARGLVPPLSRGRLGGGWVKAPEIQTHPHPSPPPTPGALKGEGTQELPPIVFRDLGNLLLMYVMTWAYLAFTQFLIIWAENLPHEIVWYIARMQGGWLAVAWLLALFHFFVPLLILLFRNAKEAPPLLGGLAAALLAFHLLDVCWMILPSMPVAAVQWLWTVPLASAVLGAILWIVMRNEYPLRVGSHEEASHA